MLSSALGLCILCLALAIVVYRAAMYVKLDCRVAGRWLAKLTPLHTVSCAQVCGAFLTWKVDAKSFVGLAVLLFSAMGLHFSMPVSVCVSMTCLAFQCAHVRDSHSLRALLLYEAMRPTFPVCDGRARGREWKGEPRQCTL